MFAAATTCKLSAQEFWDLSYTEILSADVVHVLTTTHWTKAQSLQETFT